MGSLTKGTVAVILLVIAVVVIITVGTCQSDGPIGSSYTKDRILVRGYQHDGHSYLLFNDRNRIHEITSVVHNPKCECMKEQK